MLFLICTVVAVIGVSLGCLLIFKKLPSVRKAPPFRTGMNSTDCYAILFLTLMRYLLLHNGLPNRRNRCAATKE